MLSKKHISVNTMTYADALQSISEAPEGNTYIAKAARNKSGKSRTANFKTANTEFRLTVKEGGSV